MVAPLPLQGRTLHQHAGFGFSVSPRRGGRSPELDDPEVLEWTGRLLARLHTVGGRQPFIHRPALDLAGFIIEPRHWLQSRRMIPLEIESAWFAALDITIDLIANNDQWKRTYGLNDSKSGVIRLHGDCHPGNILWSPDHGPHFVDLDDARSGPAVQDLWMLLSGEPAQRQRQLRSLLEGYEQIRAFDRRELALVEPLRTLRLIHYSVWLARRWHDPAFAPAFPEFGTLAYWREQIQALDSQIEAMLAPPLIA